MIIRGLAGLLIGIAYGVLVSAVVFLLLRPDLAKPDSGLMIMIDSAALAWFGVLVSGITAGLCAIVVGLIVGMAGLGKSKAAIPGIVIGLLVLGFLVIALGAGRLPNTLQDWVGLLVTIAIFPVGLAFTGIVVAVVGDQLNRHFLLNGR